MNQVSGRPGSRCRRRHQLNGCGIGRGWWSGSPLNCNTSLVVAFQWRRLVFLSVGRSVLASYSCQWKISESRIWRSKRVEPFLPCVFVSSLSVPSAGQLPNPNAATRSTEAAFTGNAAHRPVHYFSRNVRIRDSASVSIPIAVLFTHTWPGAGYPTPQERWRSCGERAPPVACEYQGVGNRLKERNVGREDSSPICKLTLRESGRFVKLSFCSEIR